MGKNQVRTWGSDGAQRSSAFCPRHPQPGGAQLECELGSAWLESSSPSYMLLNSDDPRLQRAFLPPSSPHTALQVLPSCLCFLARPQRVLTLAYLYVFTALSTLRVWEHRISQCLCRASSWNKLAADSSCGGARREAKGGLGWGHHGTESRFVQWALCSNPRGPACLSRSSLRTDYFCSRAPRYLLGHLGRQRMGDRHWLGFLTSQKIFNHKLHALSTPPSTQAPGQQGLCFLSARR